MYKRTKLLHILSIYCGGAKRKKFSDINLEFGKLHWRFD